MTLNPVIAFGMEATAAAMDAKNGTFDMRAELKLARCALSHAEAVPFCCSEVDCFLSTVKGSPGAAADRLLDFVRSLAPVQAPGQSEFDWQTRADLQ